MINLDKRYCQKYIFFQYVYNIFLFVLLQLKIQINRILQIMKYLHYTIIGTIPKINVVYIFTDAKVIFLNTNFILIKVIYNMEVCIFYIICVLSFNILNSFLKKKNYALFYEALNNYK